MMNRLWIVKVLLKKTFTKKKIKYFLVYVTIHYNIQWGP